MDRGPISEFIAVFVDQARALVAQLDGFDPAIRQLGEFIRVGNAIVIQVAPDLQVGVHIVALVNQAVSVSTESNLIEYSQRNEAV